MREWRECRAAAVAACVEVQEGGVFDVHDCVTETLEGGVMRDGEL